jgi:N-acetylglucosaminylphosphatidylinositol deacetylase
VPALPTMSTSTTGATSETIVAALKLASAATLASVVSLGVLAKVRAHRKASDPFASTRTTMSKEKDSSTAERRAAALVLTAHPDDESYFFAPTVQALKRSGAEVHLVCLSDGAAGGDGETRKAELLKVKELLELEGLCIVDTDDLRDGMETQWPAKTVMAVLDAYTEGAPVKFDYVVTFDGRGVSGHVNHIATYEGTRQWIEEKRNGPGASSDLPQVWVLESTNLVRKLSGALDFAMSYLETLTSSRRVFVPSPSPRQVVAAVRLHKSQFVWYRKLFLAFSRYTFMNTLRRID